MGTSLSSNVYQYKVDGCLEAISQCVAIANNIIIYGYDEDSRDHDKTVRDVMVKAMEIGMWFIPNKCQFKKTSKIIWDATK